MIHDRNKVVIINMPARIEIAYKTVTIQSMVSIFLINTARV